jgi:DNA-binding winged helix-turn-helix (wHTH) protein
MTDNSGSFPYRFKNFEFDPKGPLLAFDGELIKEVDKKTLEVLAPLVTAMGSVVSHDEIIAAVWKDNYHGVTPARINQYVSKLQKLLQKYDPETKFVENIRGRGYRFVIAVETKTGRSAPPELVQPPPPIPLFADIEKPAELSSPKSVAAYAVAGILIVSLLAVAAWVWFPRDDEKEITRVVKESQLYESLVLYKNPAAYSETVMDQYWTPELEVEGNYDRNKIRQGAVKMVSEGRRYGDETKCEQFDIQSVEINVEKDLAVVTTLEKWFIAVYLQDGTLQKNKTIGPYFVSYIVKKIDGQWRIEKSNTARAILPTPRIAKIEPETTPVAGQQFFISIHGDDLLHEVIYLKVIGEGCPESNPCKVPNSVVREFSIFQPTRIDHVPLTLGSGKFKIAGQNGDSPTGNFVEFEVP